MSSGDSSASATWDQYAGATASASVQNGALRVQTSVNGTIPQGFFDVEAFATAYFQDALTITSASVPDGTLGYFYLTARVTGSFTCDSTLISACPSGVLFGYGDGTLGMGEPVQLLGGESPVPTSSTLNLTQQLVPLPFRFGNPFNIRLDLLTTSRIISWAGNSFATNDLSHTLSVTHIGITSGINTPISDFSIASSAGLNYSADGIEPVPEPSTVSMVGGLFVMSLLMCRRRAA